MDNKFLNKYEQKSDFKPPKRRGPREAKPKNTKLIIGVISGVAAIAIIIGVILFCVLNTKVVLPDMVGWKEDDVTLWASENKVMLRYTDSYSDEITSGLVMEQNPEAGETVEKGNFLEIMLSLGADQSVMVTLPDFMSMSQAEIAAWEKENFMTKVRVTSQNSQTIEEGKVISFTVNDNTVAGTEVRRDSPIYIIISSGTGENGAITVPDFTLMTKDQANTFAEDNGIVLEIEEVFDETIAKDQIMSQDIELDEVIQVGDTIHLRISKGPEIIMPDFSGYTSEMAMTVASQNNIVMMMEEKYSSSAEGKMISQSISAGLLYDMEEILILEYSLGNTILIPSYVGQGKEAFEAWATEYNALGTNIKIQATYTTSNDMPGTIITQDKTDVMSSISTTVNVVVSKGKVVYVPDFVAKSGSGYDKAITREDAIALCEEAGLIPIFKEEAKNGRLEGEVWSQSVAAGKEVQQGTKITLTYKPVKSTVKVPDFTGMTIQEIKNAGYFNNFELVYESSANDLPVLSQSVNAGTTVAPGTQINLELDLVTDDFGDMDDSNDGTGELGDGQSGTEELQNTLVIEP